MSRDFVLDLVWRTKMAMKKKSAEEEPLLNTMARKLGHAAGTLARVTHNIGAIPEVISDKAKKPVRRATVGGRGKRKMQARRRAGK